MLPLQNLASSALRTPPLPEISPNEHHEALREKTDEFEAVLLKVLLDTAMPAQEDPLFPKQAGHDIYRSMYHDTLSKELSGGFGFSDLLFSFLTRKE